MLNIFCSPARYVQGPDASRHLAAEMRKLGIAERPLIIAAIPNLAASKLLGPITGLKQGSKNRFLVRKAPWIWPFEGRTVA